MKSAKNLVYIAVGLIFFGIIAATVLIPEIISWYYDGVVLKGVILEEKDAGVEGYKYNLSPNEKLYVLSNALNNRVLPQSDYFAAIRRQGNISNTQTQSYAFQPVYRDSEYNSETRVNALNTLITELSFLVEKNILPALEINLNTDDYETALFSAIDILEPKKNVTVWQITFSGTVIQNGLVDCIMDAQTNKVYSISIRTPRAWEQYNADEIMMRWAEYLGIGSPEPFIPDNPLVEDATYYKKYTITGMEGDNTVVTAGYYEGIHEFFLKITR